MEEKFESMTYIEMLQLWRHAPSGHEYFQGETGKLFKDIMFRKRDELSHSDQVAASKSVGWENSVCL